MTDTERETLHALIAKWKDASGQWEFTADMWKLAATQAHTYTEQQRTAADSWRRAAIWAWLVNLVLSLALLRGLW